MTALIDVVLIAFTVTAALSSTVFVVSYHRRVTWWRSRMGRSVMSLSFAVGFMAWLGIARRIDENVADLNLTPWIHPLIALMYAVVTAVMIYRLAVLLHPRDDEDRL